MKQAEVAVGRTYLAKVTDRVVPVRIDAEHPRQGWLATNQVTGKRVHIKSAQRLRREVGRNGAPDDDRPVTDAATSEPADPPVIATEVETVNETTPAPAPAVRTPSYDERLMFNGATDPAAARAALAKITTGGSEEADMASSKKTKKSTATKAPKPAAKAAPAEKAKLAKAKLSALDAAAKVLEERGEPMTTGEMIDEMAAKKYWTSPGGKTPAATLYSAILREVNLKGKDARFKKTERGKFARTKAE
jgi:hypothetical protein